MATQLFAVRLAEFNIPVYEVRPGIIHTDMTAPVTEKYDRLIAGGLTLQKRWGFPDDVGKAVRALADGFMPYSTGQIINVDGGLMMQRTSTQHLFSQLSNPFSASCTPFAPSRRSHGKGVSFTTCFRNISHCTLNALSKNSCSGILLHPSKKSIGCGMSGFHTGFGVFP